jgi:hypothetical protein
MKFRLLSVLAMPALVCGIAACDVDQTREGELPDVDVEGGALPEYDVDAADVDITKDTVVVPKIQVKPPPDTSAR